MPKEATKTKVSFVTPPFLPIPALSLPLSHRFSCSAHADTQGGRENREKPSKKPAAVLVRKTPRHPSVLSLRTCSLARTGARGSRPRIQKRASVSLSLFFTCHRHGLGFLRVGFGLGAGEVAKLLGAKWKELDEEEEKVSLNGFCLYIFFLQL
jgi:hypothetical protein